MIVRPKSKSFITSIGNLHVVRLTFLPGRYTSIIQRSICVSTYIHMFLAADVERHGYLEKEYTVLSYVSHIVAIKYFQANI